jgi:hypothetical protein
MLELMQYPRPTMWTRLSAHLGHRPRIILSPRVIRSRNVVTIVGEDMNEQPEQPPPKAGADLPGVRFEGTVHPGEQAQDVARVADLDLDRIPDREGGVRILVTLDDLVRLLDSGYEVHLYRALPVQPLSAEMVSSDDDARAWFEGQVQGIQRAEES